MALAKKLSYQEHSYLYKNIYWCEKSYLDHYKPLSDEIDDCRNLISQHSMPNIIFIQTDIDPFNYNRKRELAFAISSNIQRAWYYDIASTVSNMKIFPTLTDVELSECDVFILDDLFCIAPGPYLNDFYTRCEKNNTTLILMGLLSDINPIEFPYPIEMLVIDYFN